PNTPVKENPTSTAIHARVAQDGYEPVSTGMVLPLSDLEDQSRDWRVSRPAGRLSNTGAPPRRNRHGLAGAASGCFSRHQRNQVAWGAGEGQRDSRSDHEVTPLRSFDHDGPCEPLAGGRRPARAHGGGRGRRTEA